MIRTDLAYMVKQEHTLRNESETTFYRANTRPISNKIKSNQKSGLTIFKKFTGLIDKLYLKLSKSSNNNEPSGYD
ncbi:MAG: hypothetical protein ACXAC7_08370 [Candidatus Hodarchaeales archaeon]|jgi:hypothetical protein